MNQAIKNFIQELSTRVSLLQSMNTNLDSSKVEKIESIINKYGKINTQEYTKTDINTIADILKITSNDPILTDYIKLDKVISDYIEEYKVVKGTHEENSSNETNIYNKYIRILTSEKLDRVFTKYDELLELMSDIGVSVKDKWQILEYIDKLNIKSKESSLFAINLNSKLTVFNGLYLDNNDLTKVILNHIKDMSIDIDMIPELSKKIAGNKYNINKVQSALSTIVLNELYQQLEENKDDIESIKNLEEMVNYTMKYVESYEDTIIKPAKELVVAYEDLLNEEISKGNDINEYMDLSVKEINKQVNDENKAVNLKVLPIIKSIKETINNINNCDKTSDKYIDYLKLLTNLNAAYKEVKQV